MSRWNWAAAIALCLVGIAAPVSRAADQDLIKRTVDRGVKYLKDLQEANGTWPQINDNGIGMTALASLTLLECDVDKDDPIIQKAATFLRDSAVTVTHTYSISLCIMFFDRLADEGDKPLIESLMVRLLAGQNNSGGWSYVCPAISEDEVRRLRGTIGNRTGKERKEDPKDPLECDAQGKPVSPEIKQQLNQINQQGPLRDQSAGDNSNTQFATLALWIGRRHGLPVDNALRQVDNRFRAMQNGDGGWSYLPNGERNGLGTIPSMTCAGLLGLAVAWGAQSEAAQQAAEKAEGTPQGAKARAPREPDRDPSIKAGLLALGAMINGPFILAFRAQYAGNPRGAAAAQGPQAGVSAGPPPLSTDPTDYYMLWSLLTRAKPAEAEALPAAQ